MVGVVSMDLGSIPPQSVDSELVDIHGTHGSRVFALYCLACLLDSSSSPLIRRWLPRLPADLSNACIEIHSLVASPTEQGTSTWGLAGADSREGDAGAKTELAHSTPVGLDRAGPPLGASIVRIGQVTGGLTAAPDHSSNRTGPKITQAEKLLPEVGTAAAAD